MVCTLTVLRGKEVIEMRTGMRLGYVDDIELDTDTSQVTALVIFGRPRAFGLMGREGDIVIKCSEIALIGEDTILVKQREEQTTSRSRTFAVEDLMR